MEETTRFIEVLKDVEIIDKGFSIEVRVKNYDDGYKPLYAVISKRDKHTDYYMDDLFQNGFSNEIIDLEQLSKLQILVEQLTK